jgi:hypothetical protein
VPGYRRSRGGVAGRGRPPSFRHKGPQRKRCVLYLAGKPNSPFFSSWANVVLHLSCNFVPFAPASRSTALARHGIDGLGYAADTRKGNTGTIVMECVIDTRTSLILQLIEGLNGDLHAIFEEGTAGAWLCDLLTPHVRRRFRVNQVSGKVGRL